MKEIKNMSHEEFQAHWLSLAEKDAHSNKYEEEILKVTKRLIDSKDYSSLFAILKNYDCFTQYWKEKEYNIPKTELPFWCYGCIPST